MSMTSSGVLYRILVKRRCWRQTDRQTDKETNNDITIAESLAVGGT